MSEISIGVLNDAAIGLELCRGGGTLAGFFRVRNVMLNVLPDISAVFGPYTYLFSEILFGSVALWLLIRADALARAAVTLLVIYPIGFVWDWYTLTIGVFAIPLRTGVELAGIPLEEHIFILVVPALVLGIHENLLRR